jgi:hypothetical protein
MNVSMMVQLASVACNSRNITQRLGELHKLHEDHNNEQIQALSKKCSRIAKSQCVKGLKMRAKIRKSFTCKEFYVLLM